MNVERINELKQMTEEFNNKLEEAYKSYENNLEKERIKFEKEKKNPKKKEKEKKRKVISDNIFKDPPAWKPNNYYGEYFEEFKKLNPQYDMDSWEIFRTHLVKRSYSKETELPLKKDFKPTRAKGKEFGEKKDMSNLSDLGRSIIQQFIKENEVKEKTLKQKEEEIFQYKHSKPPLNLNPWKWSNHIITEFSVPPGDKTHLFRKEKKPTYLIQDPFRRPKRDGEYFEKSVKLI